MHSRPPFFSEENHIVIGRMQPGVNQDDSIVTENCDSSSDESDDDDEADGLSWLAK